MSRNRLRVDLLALPEATASVLYGLYDLFVSAGRDWRVLMEGGEPEPLFDVRVVVAGGQPLRMANGVPVVPDDGLGGIPDLLCIPEVLLAPGLPVRGRFDAETAWLQRCRRAHTVLATACSGAILLAEAGLLRGKEATTHWLFCETLAAYPEVRVHPRRVLVETDGGRIVMAGGGTSWQDLALYLVARFGCVDEAMHLAKLNLIDWHDVGQQPFAVLARSRQVNDAIIGRCQTWIAGNYRIHSPVSTMLELSGLSERNFTRRFRAATGLSPMEYVHTLRLEEAKQLLEVSTQSVETVAWEIGYEDASFFGRLFRRRVGLTPAQYRRRFGGLRRALANRGDEAEGGR